MFLENKYTLWYYNIINKARSIPRAPGCYVERHHIVPKSLGGLNNKSNLVYLSAKEHFICHLLLVKMSEWQKGVKKEKVSCEFCSKEISLLNYTRWHGAKCKQAS